MSNVYVSGLLEEFMPRMLAADGVAVPDDEEEMNWRLFFAHSQDMRGFRADIFTGGPNEDKHPTEPAFQGLRNRWSDSRTMISGLAAVWQDDDTRRELTRLTNKTDPVPAAYALAVGLLRGPSGNDATRLFAATLDDLKGYRISKKTAGMVRAYVQNSDLMTRHECSFREYLQSVVPDLGRGADRIVEAERAWLTSIVRDFYNVGPALASYLISDWILWLWREGKVKWFESYKADSVFLRTLATDGKLPAEAVTDFVAYSRSLKIERDWVPAGREHLVGLPVPPRLLNEAIWLRENALAAGKKQTGGS
jgi:hypothetical protein